MQASGEVIQPAQSHLDVAVVRQQTPVQISVDGDGRLLCVQIVGDRSVVLLGLTVGGAEMLLSQVSAGITELKIAQSNSGRRE